MPIHKILAPLIAASLFIAPAYAQERQVPSARSEVQLSYAPLVKTVTPAVVNVYASRVVAQQRPSGFPFDDPLFREFFGARPEFGTPRERVQRSLGSGVLVGGKGLVVTNNHVIEGMTEVRIALADQREFDVDVLLRDPRSDLAVLRVKGTTPALPTLPFGDAENVEVGDLVLAVGNPYGLGQTVTSGIISAVRRVQLGEGEQRVFLQTDAAINQGNSGGALVDMTGRLVGINTAIFSKSGGSDGIGFAIPVSIVRLVVEAAEKGEKTVRRPWLGAQLQPVTREIADTLKLERPSGALVAEVEARSPMARAGVKAGDLITTVDGREVEDPAAFTYLFTTRPLGGDARVDVRRDGQVLSLKVPVETAPESTPRDERMIDGYGPFAGARVVNLSPAVAEELGLEGQSQGVVVVDLTEDSLAARIGIKKGDRVLSINGKDVASTSDLSTLNRVSQRLWRVSIQREGRVLTQMFQF